MKEDITLENAIDHIEAISEAVREDVMKLGKDTRSMAIALIAAVMAVTAEDLKNFQSGLEASGEAAPISEEQRGSVHAILSEAMKSKAS